MSKLLVPCAMALVVAAVLGAARPEAAQATGGVAAGSVRADESHCVIEAVGQLEDGELVFGEPRCYRTLGAALLDATNGTLRVPAEISGKELLARSNVVDERLLSSFTLGIHFDGFNGSGSSITVVGASCTGGWWNTGAVWANRISSSWNGCYRLKHHDKPNRAGSSESTTGSGRVHNLSVLNNRAESVSYWSG